MTKTLIIGGGVAGIMCATKLRAKDSATDIIVVEPKEYFELTMFAFRTPFDEDDRDAALYPQQPWADKHRIQLIHSIVDTLTPDQAKLADGTTIQFDVCMVATGAANRWAACGRGPSGLASLEERKAQLEEEGERLVNADSVLIVGGGIIGCELAGEVAYMQKKRLGKAKKITLVHSKPHLCMEVTKSASNWVRSKLERKGVEVILNDKATESAGGKLVLKSSGMELDASVVIYATGIHSVNPFMDPKFINSDGWIEVDDHFRVKGSGGRLFAIGDCCTLLYNSATQITSNVDVIVANLSATLKVTSGASGDVNLETDARLQSKLKRFKVGPSAFFIALGKDDGLFNLGWFTTQRFFPWLKNTVMLGKIIDSVGIKV